MPATHLKEKLIEKIRQTEDQALLEELSNLMEIQEPSAVYVLSETQKEAVKIARAQIANKEFYANEEADKAIEQWLSE